MEEISKLLLAVLKGYVRSSEPHLVEILAPLWSLAAGKPIALHSRPAGFAGGTLTLECDCTQWTAQLRAMTEEIRAEVNAFLGAPVVRALRVRYTGSQQELRRHLARTAHPCP